MVSRVVVGGSPCVQATHVANWGQGQPLDTRLPGCGPRLHPWKEP